MFVPRVLEKLRADVGALVLSGSLVFVLSPVVSPRAGSNPAQSAVSISAGGNHTCAVLSTGTVDCWGTNSNGELGDGGTHQSPVPVHVSGLSGAAQISVGVSHTCAVLSGGTIDCWGKNSYGELGNGLTSSSSVPTKVSGITGATQVAAGGSHTCALLAAHTVECWGRNEEGELGIGTKSVPIRTPRLVKGIDAAVQLSAGRNFTCAVLASGAIECWGSDRFGELGHGSFLDSASPRPVTGISNAVSVSAGDLFACALLADRAVDCWGNDDRGQLGDGGGGGLSAHFVDDEPVSPIPMEVWGLRNATAVFAGGGVGSTSELSGGYHAGSDGETSTQDGHACALVENQAPRCWGDGSFGELGPQVTPSGTVYLTGDVWSGFSKGIVRLDSITGAASMALGGLRTCALTGRGAVECLGENTAGQLGNGKLGFYATPVQVVGIKNASTVAVGALFSCARLLSGRVECWGYSGGGVLGHGTYNASAVPVLVKGIKRASSVSAEGADLGGNIEEWHEQACAVLVRGDVKCWGSGPLGNGNAVWDFSATPVRVDGVQNARGVSANAAGDACVVLLSGQVKCWGFSLSKNARKPTLVAGVRDAISVATESNNPLDCALLRSQEVECWGWDEKAHQIQPWLIHGVTHTKMLSSDGDTCALIRGGSVDCWSPKPSILRVPAPRRVPGVRDATAIGNPCVVLSNGEVKCWSAIGRSSDMGEVRAGIVPGITNARAVSASVFHACAVLADHTIRCWGLDLYGELGNGGMGFNATPVGVTGLS